MADVIASERDAGARTWRVAPATAPDREPRTGRWGHAPGGLCDRSLLEVVSSFAQVLLISVLVCTPVQWVLSQFWVPRVTFAPAALATLCYAALSAVTVRLLTLRAWPRWGDAAAAGVLSLISTVTLGTVLMGTRHYLGGIVIDQQFRIEYLTRLTDSARLADFAYQGLPPFYPASWFWLGGRFANLLHLAGWAAYKPWAIETMAVAGAIVFPLWSLVTDRRRALLLAVTTSVIGLLLGAAEPYSWFASATIPPLLVLAWQLLTALRTSRPGDRPPTLMPSVVLGVFLGLYGMVYTLLWGFAVFLLGVATLICVGQAMRDRRGNDGHPIGPLVAAIALRAAGIGLIMAGLMLLVWTPFLTAVLQGAHAVNYAAHYLPPHSAMLPTPMLEMSVTGALCLAGLVWIVLNLDSHPMAQAFLIGVVAVYGWFLLSNLLIPAGTTLMAFRLIPVLVTMLCCAAVLAAEQVSDWAQHGLPALPARSIRRLNVVLGLAIAFTLLQQVPAANQADIDLAFANYYPDGNPPSRVRDPGAADAWLKALADTVGEMTGREPNQLTVLTDDWSLMSVQPYWSFQASTPHYAHPLSDFDARRAEVERWAATRSPDELLAALAASRFPTPDVFILRQSPDGGLRIFVSRDDFPKQPNVKYYEVRFPASLFESQAFATKVVGPYTVIVRR